MPNVTSASSVAFRPEAFTGAIPTNLPKFSAGASAQQVLADVKSGLAMVKKNGTVDIAEARWVVAAAQVGGAAVLALLKSELAGVPQSKKVMAGGFGAFLAQLGGAPTGTTTGGGSTGPVVTPGGTTTPVNPGSTAGGTTPAGVQIQGQGAIPAGEIIAHYKGPVTFAGDYRPTADALKNKYANITSLEEFGTTKVSLPDGKFFTVRDQHYEVEPGKFGMRFIPVADGDAQVTKLDGTKTNGHELLDAFLRKAMGLGPNDQIFALIPYIHPEGHAGSLKDLAGGMLKTEGGRTHLGAYTGGGRTTNSPETYHNNEFEVAGYPNSPQMVSLDGVSQPVMNQSLFNVDTILNNGVEFPPDYKNDWFKTADLATTLDFYKRWVRDDPTLREDPKWQTYCAEHKTIVTNVGLNLPSNEKAYQEVYGAEDGKKLFAEVKAKFKTIKGVEMPETDFVPLWKLEGITSPATETRFGKGLAWPAETTADMVNDFFNVYADFREVSGTVINAALMGFMDTLGQCTGIKPEEYMKLTVPVMSDVMVAEALTQTFALPADLQAWVKGKTAELYVAFGGKKEDFAPGATINPATMGLAQNVIQGVVAAAPKIFTDGGMSREKAQQWLRGSLEDNIEYLRSIPIGDPEKPQLFSPPDVTYRVENGIQESSRFVHIKTLCTCMDAAELQPAGQ